MLKSAPGDAPDSPPILRAETMISDLPTKPNVSPSKFIDCLNKPTVKC